MITFLELGHYGRLGNQLFQVASTIGIAAKNNYVAEFPRWYCNYTKKNMSDFFMNPVKQDLDKSKVVHHYQEPHFNYTDFPCQDNTSLHGYFQSTKYFEHCEDQIRHYFTPSWNTLSMLDSKYGISRTKNRCSIHVRRGDYVNNPVHAVCDENYYRQAIAKVKSSTNVDEFFVFSDDIEWCRTQFPKDFIFVTGNHDVEDMFLMSMCNHNIISNSSFSWWGSFLNEHDDKIIITPSRWFGETVNINYSDIYFKNMIKI